MVLGFPLRNQNDDLDIVIHIFRRGFVHDYGISSCPVSRRGRYLYRGHHLSGFRGDADVFYIIYSG
jgi:hypothetical protein